MRQQQRSICQQDHHHLRRHCRHHRSGAEAARQRGGGGGWRMIAREYLELNLRQPSAAASLTWRRHKSLPRVQYWAAWPPSWRAGGFPPAWMTAGAPNETASLPACCLPVGQFAQAELANCERFQFCCRFRQSPSSVSGASAPMRRRRRHQEIDDERAGKINHNLAPVISKHARERERERAGARLDSTRLPASWQSPMERRVSARAAVRL